METYSVTVDQLGPTWQRGDIVTSDELGESVDRLVALGAVQKCNVNADTPVAPLDVNTLPDEGPPATLDMAQLIAKATGLGIDPLPTSRAGLVGAIDIAMESQKVSLDHATLGLD